MEQGELPFRGRKWGGARGGAGRRPKGEKAGVRPCRRPAVAARFPVHVTWKFVAGLPPMRDWGVYLELLEVFAKGCEREGFRMVEFAVQDDHLHVICEAEDREALVRGLQGLAIRVAKRLNRLWGRKGRGFADRYHEHVLKSPTEVRNALRYVVQNSKRHGRGQLQPLDMLSSGPWFDGWLEDVEVTGLDEVPVPVARAQTWLGTIGWRRLGRISVHDIPGSKPPSPSPRSRRRRAERSTSARAAESTV